MKQEVTKHQNPDSADVLPDWFKELSLTSVRLQSSPNVGHARSKFRDTEELKTTNIEQLKKETIKAGTSLRLASERENAATQHAYHARRNFNEIKGDLEHAMDLQGLPEHEKEKIANEVVETAIERAEQRKQRRSSS